ncbi:hypothetical protein Bca101_047162 [Brassica carinata]
MLASLGSTPSFFDVLRQPICVTLVMFFGRSSSFLGQSSYQDSMLASLGSTPSFFDVLRQPICVTLVMFFGVVLPL